MSEQIHRARRALPELNALVDDVALLADRVGAAGITIDDFNGTAEGRAGLMAVGLVSKQREHLRSIRVLMDADQHRDAWLLARTMVEGLARLSWAHRNQPAGPDEWFWFGVVEDWRQLKENMDNGIAVDPEELAI